MLFILRVGWDHSVIAFDRVARIARGAGAPGVPRPRGSGSSGIRPGLLSGSRPPSGSVIGVQAVAESALMLLDDGSGCKSHDQAHPEQAHPDVIELAETDQNIGDKG